MKDRKLDEESKYTGNDCMLTTIDNPWNPFTHFKEWYSHDTSYRIIPQVDPDAPVATCTSEYLARIAITSNNFSEEENKREMYEAMKEIVRIDPFHIYKIVYPNSYES